MYCCVLGRNTNHHSNILPVQAGMTVRAATCSTPLDSRSIPISISSCAGLSRASISENPSAEHAAPVSARATGADISALAASAPAAPTPAPLIRSRRPNRVSSAVCICPPPVVKLWGPSPGPSALHQRASTNSLLRSPRRIQETRHLVPCRDRPVPSGGPTSRTVSQTTACTHDPVTGG
jgi:hypothetical protein